MSTGTGWPLSTLWKKEADSLVKRVEWLSLRSTEKRMALSASELRESPSTSEREGTGPRLFNDKRVVLSPLKRRRWPYVDGKKEWPLFTLQRKWIDSLVQRLEWLSLISNEKRVAISSWGIREPPLYFRKKRDWPSLTTREWFAHP